MIRALRDADLLVVAPASADLLGAKLPDNAAEDSVSILPALLAKADRPLREAVVHHSIGGRFSIRQGPWKLELCAGSGGSVVGREAADLYWTGEMRHHDVLAAAILDFRARMEAVREETP